MTLSSQGCQSLNPSEAQFGDSLAVNWMWLQKCHFGKPAAHGKFSHSKKRVEKERALGAFFLKGEVPRHYRGKCTNGLQRVEMKRTRHLSFVWATIHLALLSSPACHTRCKADDISSLLEGQGADGME
jgi:hypothetical protein